MDGWWEEGKEGRIPKKFGQLLMIVLAKTLGYVQSMDDDDGGMHYLILHHF